MTQLKKKTFYLDLEKLSPNLEDFDNLKVKDLTSDLKEVNSQLRRGSTHTTTEPVTLKENKLKTDQQHSDPGQIIQIKRISHAEA
jgi:hypothetical protein